MNFEIRTATPEEMPVSYRGKSERIGETFAKLEIGQYFAVEVDASSPPAGPNKSKQQASWDGRCRNWGKKLHRSFSYRTVGSEIRIYRVAP